MNLYSILTWDNLFFILLGPREVGDNHEKVMYLQDDNIIFTDKQKTVSLLLTITPVLHERR
jgi:hypothetical protein